MGTDIADALDAGQRSGDLEVREQALEHGAYALLSVERETPGVRPADGHCVRTESCEGLCVRVRRWSERVERGQLTERLDDVRAGPDARVEDDRDVLGVRAEVLSNGTQGLKRANGAIDLTT